MQHAFVIGEELIELWLSQTADGHRLHVGKADYPVGLQPMGAGLCRLRFDNETHDVLLATDGDRVFIHFDGVAYDLQYVDAVSRYASHHGPSADDVILAPMPGTVVSIAVEPGQPVGRGDVLIVIESMKLETAIKSSRAGVVEAVHFTVGQVFERAAPLVTMAPEA